MEKNVCETRPLWGGKGASCVLSDLGDYFKKLVIGREKKGSEGNVVRRGKADGGQQWGLKIRT